MIECRVTRQAHGSYSKMFPTYVVEAASGLFLMRGKKEVTKTTSYHSIMMSREDVDQESDNFLAKLKGNFKSTEFTAYDAGANPKNICRSQAARFDQLARQELVVMQFTQGRSAGQSFSKKDV